MLKDYERWELEGMLCDLYTLHLPYWVLLDLQIHDNYFNTSMPNSQEHAYLSMTIYFLLLLEMEDNP